VSAVTSVVAVRPVVEFHSTADAAGRAPVDPRLPEDKVTLSPEAKRELQGHEAAAQRATKADGLLAKALDPQQEKEVADLKQRDAHVRQHEAAHQAAGGDLTGTATFSYRTGPDGRSYAVGGGVPIAARSGRTPDETIAIARRVRAAALAPADPSPADLAAAASATQMEMRAQQQKQAVRSRETEARGPDGLFDRVYLGTPVDRVA